MPQGWLSWVTGHNRLSKPASSTPPDFCFSSWHRFLPWVPALTSLHDGLIIFSPWSVRENKSFPPRVAFAHGIYCNSRKQIWKAMNFQKLWVPLGQELTMKCSLQQLLRSSWCQACARSQMLSDSFLHKHHVEMGPCKTSEATSPWKHQVAQSKQDMVATPSSQQLPCNG